MQDFRCNYVKSKYGDKTGKLPKDTNSFMYKNNTENVYKYFYKDKQLFDFCYYLENSKYYNNTNNLTLK